MGATQSRRRTSYNQTLQVVYRRGHVEEPCGQCTIFNEKPTNADSQTTIKCPPGVQSDRPPQKRQTFNSTRSIRNRRVLLPIIEGDETAQNMTDDVTGDLTTTTGFLSFAELRESMRRKRSVKRQDDSEYLEMVVRNNSALPKHECEQTKTEPCVVAAAPELELDIDENTDIRSDDLYQDDLVFKEEKLFETFDDDGCENTLITNDNSDSDSNFAPLKKLSYEMRKEYYYL